MASSIAGPSQPRPRPRPPRLEGVVGLTFEAGRSRTRARLRRPCYGRGHGLHVALCTSATPISLETFQSTTFDVSQFVTQLMDDNVKRGTKELRDIKRGRLERLERDWRRVRSSASSRHLSHGSSRPRRSSRRRCRCCCRGSDAATRRNFERDANLARDCDGPAMDEAMVCTSLYARESRRASAVNRVGHPKPLPRSLALVRDRPASKVKPTTLPLLLPWLRCRDEAEPWFARRSMHERVGERAR
jgi:hypothetical protein